MGACWCKQKNDDTETYFPQQSANHSVDGYVYQLQTDVPPEYYLESSEKGCPDSETVDSLVLETLDIIGTLVDK